MKVLSISYYHDFNLTKCPFDSPFDSPCKTLLYMIK